MQYTQEQIKEQFTQMVTEQQSHYYRLAYSYTKNRDSAMDIVQEAIVKAMPKLTTLRNPDYMKTWFYRIVINESLSHLRKHRRNIVEEDLSFLSVEDTDASDAIDLYRAVDKLEPKLRTVILLRFYEDMKLDEIAQVTHTNINTVKSRLYKALEQLKPWIAE